FRKRKSNTWPSSATCMRGTRFLMLMAPNGYGLIPHRRSKTHNREKMRTSRNNHRIPVEARVRGSNPRDRSRSRTHNWIIPVKRISLMMGVRTARKPSSPPPRRANCWRQHATRKSRSSFHPTRINSPTSGCPRFADARTG
ncbi:uncharacterized protein METZ01_LOCUS365672, partial [marine metagenome]